MHLLRFAHAPETIRIGDTEIRRLGFDATPLVRADRASAHAVLKRAVELGVQLIHVGGDTMAAELVLEALSPYPSDLVIAVTIGGERSEGGWRPALARDALFRDVERMRDALELQRLQVVQLRWTEQPEVALDDALDAMRELQRAGSVRNVALGNVTGRQLEGALASMPVSAVVSVIDPVLLAACERRALAYVPIFQLAPRTPAPSSSAVELAARRLGCTPAQLVLASLLARSPALLPVPGASKVVHLEEHVGSVHVNVDEQTVRELAA